MHCLPAISGRILDGEREGGVAGDCVLLKFFRGSGLSSVVFVNGTGAT